MIFTIDILALLICTFTIILARRNSNMDPHKSRHIIKAATLTFVIIVLECITILCENSQNYKIFLFYRLVNAFGFSMTPLVIINLAMLYWSKIKKYKTLLFIPFLINAFLSFASVKTGWIFYVSTLNEYSRGPLFILQTLCSAIYYIVLVYCSFRELKSYDREDQTLLGFIFMIIAFGVTMQIIFPTFLFIWGSVAVSILLYYVFLRELQFRYDPMTKVFNRAVFEKHMELLSNSDNIQVIVMDINNLKLINDNYGHLEGDFLISESAKIIEQSFKGIGRIYRIGGDEFCILIEHLSLNDIEQYIRIFQRLISDYNSNSSAKFNIEIAYGISEFIKENKKNLYEVFTEADNEMYKCKDMMKKYKLLQE
ncbi:MAG: GGDEF domain-containing protein [Aminipila sp.]